MVHIQVKGVQEALTSIDRIPKQLQQGLLNAVDDMIEQVRTDAEAKFRGDTTQGNGATMQDNHWTSSIEEDRVVGRFWNDNAVAMYREFGTGPEGEENHEGISPETNPVYHQGTWFIPVKDVSVDLNAVYGMRIIKIDGEEFYLTRGQRAKPWLYPSAKQVSDNSERIVQNHINESLKELGK